MDKKHSVIIIGSGPAGLTAALYSARANFKPLVFEGIQPGGQLTITTEVENYPGFPDGILGPQLMDLFRKQAQRFDARTVFQDVTKVDFGSRPFRVWSNEELHLADTVIVATGASAKWLGIPSEQRYMGHGVSACATCDGFFFRGLEVAVVGGGDTAMEEANFLTRFASKVTIVHRRDRLRASKIMQDRTLANPKIAVMYDASIEEITGSDVDGKKAVTGMRVRNVKTGCGRGSPHRRRLHGDRPSAEHGPVPRTDHTQRKRLHRRRTGDDEDERPGRVRRGRRRGPVLPPGGDGRRLRVHGGDGRRTIPGIDPLTRPSTLSCINGTPAPSCLHLL